MINYELQKNFLKLQEKSLEKIRFYNNPSIEEFFEYIYYKNKQENSKKRKIEYSENELIDFFQLKNKDEIENYKDFIKKVQVEFWSDVHKRLVKVKLVLKS